MPQITLGSVDDDHVRIQVLHRTHPEMDDYWDGNWLDAEVSIAMGPWRGTYVAHLRTDEFALFRTELAEMSEGNRTEATFAPMEPWLEFSLERDRRGHLTLKGQASPEYRGIFGVVELEFELTDFLDQSHLPPLIAELDAVGREFPVIGSRGD